MTTADLLAERLRSGPDRPALVEGATGRVVRWRDVAALADQLRASGAPAVPMALRLADPLDNAAAFLAALVASVPVVPLDPDGPNAPDDMLRGATDGAAVVMSSSGTTGRPKVVPLTEAQLLATACAVVEHHELGPHDRGYCPLPLFHINALVVGVLSTLVAGSTLVLDRRFSRRAFWSTVAARDVTWVNAVPAIIAILGLEPPPDAAVARRIRFVRSASAPLAPAVKARFEAATGIGVLETYGMTEAASQITANPLRAVDRRAGSVGRPVGLELRVMGPGGRPEPVGGVGEVEIRGPSVATTAVDGWLSTADLGHLDADGFLYLDGRADDVINRGGEKVYPVDVERVLLADPRVTAAAVVARPHPVFGQEPVAFVLVGPAERDADAVAADLARRCQSALSRFKVPAQIIVADALPAGPTGKVRRAELRRTVMQRSPS